VKNVVYLLSLSLLTCALPLGAAPAHAEFAIAWGQRDSQFWHGWAKNKKTAAEAKKIAMDLCQKGGTRECRLIVTGNKQCVALAVPDKGKAVGYWSKKFLRGDAETAAANSCEAKGVTCTIRIAFCDDYVKP